MHLSWPRAALLVLAGVAGVILPSCRSARDPEPEPAVGTSFEFSFGRPATSRQALASQAFDPADVVAQQRAQAMLEAERRLRQKVDTGQLKIAGRVLGFDELGGWRYEDGLKGLPQRIAGLSGQAVTMVGFMLPIDDLENIREFVLVGSLWACCFGQPPDTHELVRVIVKGRPVNFQFDPIQVEGTLRVSATIEDGLCLDIYQLEASSIKKIKIHMSEVEAEPATTRPTATVARDLDAGGTIAPTSRPDGGTLAPTSRPLDPWDLAVMRDAEALRAKEKELQRAIGDGRLLGVGRYLPFDEISGWPYVNGLNGMPAKVRSLDGTRCLMAGFMLPINRRQQMREFVLVKSLWACCFGQPPDTHEMVRVVLQGDLKIDHHNAPVQVVGTLRVRAKIDEDGYCLDVFELQADSVQRIDLP